MTRKKIAILILGLILFACLLACGYFGAKTARRTYQTMLIQNLKLDTTKETYNAIVVEITFLELVIVAAQTVTLASIRQKNPGKTASMTSGGPRRPQTMQQKLLRGSR